MYLTFTPKLRYINVLTSSTLGKLKQGLIVGGAC